jgi:hypothetical protein
MRRKYFRCAECHDDGAIDEEDLAALGLILELFDHAPTAARHWKRGRPNRPACARVEQSPISADVQPLSGRSGCLHASVGLGAKLDSPVGKGSITFRFVWA